MINICKEDSTSQIWVNREDIGVISMFAYTKHEYEKHSWFPRLKTKKIWRVSVSFKGIREDWRRYFKTEEKAQEEVQRLLTVKNG